MLAVYMLSWLPLLLHYMQALARRELGEEVTLFERIHDGVQAINSGNVVRLTTKPQLVARVLFFSVGQVCHTAGCYSHGRVTVTALPEEVYGATNRHTWPIRRIEGVVAEQDLAEHAAKEMMKVQG